MTTRAEPEHPRWRTRAFVQPLLVIVLGCLASFALTGFSQWSDSPGNGEAERAAAYAEFIFLLITGLAAGLSSPGLRVGVQAMTFGIVTVAAVMAVAYELHAGNRNLFDIEGLVSGLVFWVLSIAMLLIPIGVGWSIGILLITLVRSKTTDR